MRNAVGSNFCEIKLKVNCKCRQEEHLNVGSAHETYLYLTVEASNVGGYGTHSWGHIEVPASVSAFSSDILKVYSCVVIGVLVGVFVCLLCVGRHECEAGKCQNYCIFFHICYLISPAKVLQML